MIDQQQEETTRQVTILSSNLPVFNQLPNKIGAAATSELINHCFEISSSVIELYKGTIIKLEGNACLAVFGIDNHNADSVKLAIKAALELKDKILELNDDKKPALPLEINISINTGPAFVSMVGPASDKRLSLIGETLEITERISELAEKNQLFVGPETYKLAQNLFQFEALEPLPIKGMMKPLAIYEVIPKQTKQFQRVQLSGRTIASSMVGRISEYDLFQKKVLNLIDGKGSIVNIVGKAGIGKSRLVEELRKKEFTKKLVWFDGRALSEGKNLSYHPINHIIKSWAGIKEDDRSDTASEKLYTSINRIYPEQTHEIYPFIATMMGLRLNDPAIKRVEGIEGEPLEMLILKNLRDLIAKASEYLPVLIVIEDLHWADDSSISFLESLYKLTHKHRVMFVNVFRPGYKDTGDRIQNYLEDTLPGNFLTLHVESLTKNESEALIDNLLHHTGLPDEITHLIIEKADGNPFFMEEVIRNFIDEGIIEIKDEHFIVTDRISQVNIPESINEVILSRIDKLDEKTRSLLKTASVIGRNFYYKVLEEATDTIGELDMKLGYLKDVQLINEQQQKDEIEFLFKHALAQQATYESIILKSRKELHLKIARSIEKVFAEKINEFYGTLAWHYEKAEMQEKTEEYLIKAGDEAMKTAASSEAIHYFNKVLTLINYRSNSETEEKRLDISEKLAYAYYANGQNVKSADLFNTVLKSYNLAVNINDKFLTRLKVMTGMIRFNVLIRFWSGKIKRTDNPEDHKLLKMVLFKGEAIATYSPKEAFIHIVLIANRIKIKTLANSDYGAGILLEISTVFPWSGRSIKFGKLLNRFAQSVMDEKTAQIWLIGKYVDVMFEYFADRLSPESVDEKAFRLGIETGQVWAPTIYHSFKSISLVELGLKQKAEGVLTNMKTLATTLENSLSFTQYFRARQTYLLKFRLLDEVIKNADEYIGYSLKTDHKTLLLLNYCLVSMSLCLKNDTHQARLYFYKADDLRKVLWLNYYISITLLTKAYIEYTEIKCAGQNKYKEALNNFSMTTKALLSATNKVNCTKTEAFRFRAIYYQLSGKPGKAFRYYRKSIDFATWYGARLELSRTYFELGKFLSDPMNKRKQFEGLSGKDYLEKAKSMFEEMDLQWDLNEYKKYMQNAVL